MTTPRVSVRASFGRRGCSVEKVPGWLVSGPRSRVFFERESAARWYADQLRVDPSYWVTLEDFER